MKRVLQQCVRLVFKRTECAADLEMSCTLAHDEEPAADFWVDRVQVAGKKVLLKGCHLSLKGGEICGIMGASGAGKTTLLRTMARRTRAEIVNGHSIWNRERITVPWLRQHASFVPTDTGHLPQKWTVAETLHYYDVYCDGVETVASSLDLDNSLDTLVHDLSTGQAKRLLLASAVLQHSKFICLDEPTSGLSDSDALQMMRCCVAVRKQRPSTVLVMVLHQPRDAIFRLLDRVVLVREGRLVWNGTIPHLESHMVGLGMPCPHPLLLSTHVADHWESLPFQDIDDPHTAPILSRSCSCGETALQPRKPLWSLVPNWWRWDRRQWPSFLWHASMLFITVALLSAIFSSDMFPLTIMRRAQIMYTSLPLHLFFIVAFKRDVLWCETTQRCLDIYSLVASPAHLWLVADLASWFYALFVSGGIVLITRRVDGWRDAPLADLTHVLIVFLGVRCTLTIRNLFTHIAAVRQWSHELPMYVCCGLHLIAEGTNGIFVQASDLTPILRFLPWLNPLYYAYAAILHDELGDLYESDFDSDPIRVIGILCGILAGLNGFWLLSMELGANRAPL